MFVFLPYLNVFSSYPFYLTHLVFYLFLFFTLPFLFFFFFLALFIYPLVFSGFLHFFILIFYFTFPPILLYPFPLTDLSFPICHLTFPALSLCKCTQSLEQYCPFAARISELRCGNCVVNVLAPTGHHSVSCSLHFDQFLFFSNGLCPLQTEVSLIMSKKCT